jgi:hypothetical protein
VIPEQQAHKEFKEIPELLVLQDRKVLPDQLEPPAQLVQLARKV